MTPRPTLALLALLATPALAQHAPVTDAEFVAKAVSGNLFEIESSKFAVQRATDPALKQYGMQMIKDHTDALEALHKATGKDAPQAMQPEQQAMVHNLQGLQKTDLDKIYAADQVMAHAETKALLADYIQNGKDEKLKAWAKDTLPVVERHLKTIAAL